MEQQVAPMGTVPAEEEAHVAGFVVRAYPKSVPQVTRALEALPGVRVHAATPDGKLVVTIEAADAATVADSLCTIQTMPGVLAAALVYQHVEAAAALDEEMHVESHPPGLR